MQAKMLRIERLSVAVNGEEIIRNLSLTIKRGELHLLMGPNAAGKSTLAYALVGHPNYRVTAGTIKLGSQKINDLSPEERSRLGLFLAFQHPVGIEGVSLFELLREEMRVRERGGATREILNLGEKLSQEVGLESEALGKELNLGLSGGEGKKSEILQALALQPEFAVFDESDSGLDVDGLKLFGDAVQGLVKHGTGVLAISHYPRILKYLKPDFVHVMVGGRIVESGGPKLAKKIEREGYKGYGQKES